MSELKYTQLKYADTAQVRVPVTRGMSFKDKDYNPTEWTRPNCLDIAKLPAWADHPDVKLVPQAVWDERTQNGRFPLEFNAEVHFRNIQLKQEKRRQTRRP